MNGFDLLAAIWLTALQAVAYVLCGLLLLMFIGMVVSNLWRRHKQRQEWKRHCELAIEPRWCEEEEARKAQ
jgi:hypothetical protein